MERRFHETDSRVIKPAQSGGVLLDERHFRLEDIGELTRELMQKSEGRLRALQEAAKTIEDRLKRQTEASRRRIERAMAVAQEKIDQKIQETHEKANDLLIERHREGYETGYAEGKSQGEREGFERGYQEGLERGLEEGLAEGRTRGEAETRQELSDRFHAGTESAIQLMEQLATELNREWGQAVESARQNLVEVSLGVARTVIQRETKVDPSIVRETVSRALDHLETYEQLVVEIHPEDRRFVEEYLGGFLDSKVAGISLEFRENLELDRGGCRLRTRNGEVRATIEDQLNQLGRALEEAGGY